MTSALPSLAFVFTDVVPRVWSPLVFPHEVCVCVCACVRTRACVCPVYYKIGRVCVGGCSWVAMEVRFLLSGWASVLVWLTAQTACYYVKANGMWEPLPPQKYQCVSPLPRHFAMLCHAEHNRGNLQWSISEWSFSSRRKVSPNLNLFSACISMECERRIWMQWLLTTVAARHRLLKLIDDTHIHTQCSNVSKKKPILNRA